MSLDVYLYAPERSADPSRCGTGVFVRENGATREITREEWAERFPHSEPVVLQPGFSDDGEIYSRNITHNLNRMADEAGIYAHLWRPDEIGIATAAQLIEPLREGLRLLRSEPERFRRHNPKNGWGDYEGLVDFVAEYLAACEANPDARVEVSR